MIKISSIKRRHEVNMIHLSGDLAFDTFDKIQLAIDRLQEKNGDPVVLDLSDVEYLDSRGASFLLSVKRQLSDRAVTLCAVPPFVYKVLSILGLTEQFRIFDSVEEAMKADLRMGVLEAAG